jgi:hypothetical protein
VFAAIPVALSAMQEVVTIAKGGQAFEDAYYCFCVASLFLAARTALAMLLLIWTILCTYHLVSAQLKDQQVTKERKMFVDT